MAVWGTGQNYVPKIGKNFTGKIDEVRFLDIATTTFSQYSNNGVTTNTKGLWHFSEGGSATSTADSSSSNKAAALVSTTWTTNHVEVGVGKYDRDFTGTNGYDKAGNRTQMRLINQTGSVSSDVTWQMEYNNLNQLTQRHNGTDGYFASGTERYTYTYDENGNLHTLHKETKTGTTWSTSEYWVYEYNPRNQLTQATKYSSTSGGYLGKEVYHYCLSCDGAMSEWLTYSNASETLPTNCRRYEYDGLNVLRVDEVCDTNLSGYIDTGEETWRTIEVNTHKPGSLGALIGKRVYQYSTRATTTPSSTNDYTYTYDAVGNVQVIYRASGTIGQEAYFFTQDAFGNELSGDTTTPASNRTNLLGGASWTTARTAGITEHQTGKILSSFTGLYYYGARWYDPVVGRWISRSTLPTSIERHYEYNNSNPVYFVDTNGVYGWYPYPGHNELPELPSVPTWVPGQKYLDCLGACFEYFYASNPYLLISYIPSYFMANAPIPGVLQLKPIKEGALDWGSLYRCVPDRFPKLQKWGIALSDWLKIRPWKYLEKVTWTGGRIVSLIGGGFMAFETGLRFGVEAGCAIRCARDVNCFK